MRISTFTKFFISAALVVIFLALCLTLALRWVIENSFMTHTKKTTGNLIIQHIENLTPDDFSFDDPQQTKATFTKFYEHIKNPDIIRIKVWDTSGRVIFSNDETIIGKTFSEDKEYQQSLQGNIVTKDATPQKSKAVYEEVYWEAMEVYVPITFNGLKSPSGVIEIYENVALEESILAQIGVVQIISTTVFVLAAFILFYVLFKLIINKPLDKLIKATKQFETGDLSSRVQIESYDEIGRLGFAFNTMASRLQEYYLHLEEKVIQRTKDLQKAESYYHLLFDNAPIGIGLADIKGNVISSNIAIQKFVGYSKEELKNINLADTYENPEDRKKIMEILQKTNKIVGQQVRLKRKDGKVVDGLLSVTKFYADGKELIQSTIEDITAQKMAERELAKHAVELEKTKIAVLNLLEDLKVAKLEVENAKIKDDAILENIGEGLVVTDLNGKITLINKAAALMLGWEVKDLLGKELEKVVTLEDEKGELVTGDKRPCKIVINSYKASSCSIVKANYFVRKDQTTFPVALIAAPILLNHKVVGVVEIFRDITREKEIDREKSEFLSIAAHQLRTPLGSMRWSFEMLLNGDFGELPKDIKKMLSTIYESNQGMISLVNDLLDVSRIEQGRISNNPKPTNISDVVKSVIDQMQIDANNKEVTINLLEKKEKVPQLMLDPLHLQQAISNLVSNAIKYNVAHGKVDIFFEKLANSIKISITNTGKSIPTDEQHRLFTKFFRGRDAVKSEAYGTGLGLFVVKFYVESWGGKVWVKSPSLGDNQGTTFFVELPLKPNNLK
ncbi:MAG: PAS domain S-box protein [Microgenomates group bacterium]